MSILDLLIGKAMAQAPTLEPATDMAVPSAPNVLMPNLILIVSIIGLFVLFVYLPQKRRNREHSSMLSDLSKGDKVVTTGGIVGKVIKNSDNKELLLETGEGHRLTVLRAAISGKYEQIVVDKPQMTSVGANEKEQEKKKSANTKSDNQPAKDETSSKKKNNTTPKKAGSGSSDSSLKDKGKKKSRSAH